MKDALLASDQRVSTFSRLAERARGYLPEEKLALVQRAYEFAAKAHEGQVRLSGEAYVEHPLFVSLILAELQLDASALSAALLHDVTENCGVSNAQIESKFGAEIARLVDGVTKLGKVSWQASDAAASQSHLENLRKMLVAMAQDLRVVFIKLADRLHNMLTLDALPPEKQYSISQETIEIYAPLAHRLGIWELKWQLEDLAFRYIQTEKYHEIASLVASRRVQREEFIAGAISILREEFQRVGLSAEVSGRPKHIYSIFQKIERYAAIGKHFDDIHDLFALRVLAGTVQDCYTALGVVHGLWHPLPDAFDDFVANPKSNGYQSLHTTVMSKGMVPLEVQIRTREMHHIAEYGIAAHWRYKEGDKKDLHFEEKIAWLRQLVEWHRELSGAEEFLESVKTDIFIDQVFVYTPKGEIKDLPKGSTPLDYAYRVHTNLGHSCVGAKVNGRLVPLTYQLKNGDVVEILTAKAGKGPSQDWLSPYLGYIKTSQARQKIRQWFKKQEKTENIERGRDLLDKELRHLGIKLSAREELAKQFKYDSLDDFLAAIGEGGISPHQIMLKITEEEAESRPTPETAPPKPAATPSSIHVLGVGDLLTRLARCCNPVPGDKIIGYVTRTRGVSIHRADCPNIVHEDEKERLITVEWGKADAVYPVNVQVEALNRVGLMRDISTLVAEEKVNIAGVSVVNHDDYSVTMFFTLDTLGLAQLSRLLVRMEGIRGVLGVTRVGNAATNS